MVKTRAHKRSVARSYRRHLKASKCRGKGPAACRGTAGCRVASGKKRSFCRTRKNTRTRRHQRGGLLAGATSAAKQAFLPYVMYKAQKHQQRRVHKRNSRTQKRKSRR